MFIIVTDDSLLSFIYAALNVKVRIGSMGISRLANLASKDYTLSNLDCQKKSLVLSKRTPNENLLALF